MLFLRLKTSILSLNISVHSVGNGLGALFVFVQIFVKLIWIERFERDSTVTKRDMSIECKTKRHININIGLLNSDRLHVCVCLCWRPWRKHLNEIHLRKKNENKYIDFKCSYFFPEVKFPNSNSESIWFKFQNSYIVVLLLRQFISDTWIYWASEWVSECVHSFKRAPLKSPGKHYTTCQKVYNLFVKSHVLFNCSIFNKLKDMKL